MSPQMIVDCVADYLAPRIGQSSVRHLDVGAGWGHLIRRMRDRCPAIQSEGCDFNPEHNETPDLLIQKVNLNKDALPYPNNCFDLVTCTEVLEHLENFRKVVREIGRVTNSGGMVFISTPNVLSLRSRFRFLFRGFYEYFDPFPPADDTSYYPGERHITPVTFYYLAHALMEAGFGQITPGYDKQQRFSKLIYPILAPLCHWSAKANLKRRRRKLKPVPDDIEGLAMLNNSRPILTGRTMFVTAIKAA